VCGDCTHKLAQLPSSLPRAGQSAH
jgi:hypothetical protein